MTEKEAIERAESYTITKEDIANARENKERGYSNWAEATAERIARKITDTDGEVYDEDNPEQWESLSQAVKSILENTSEGAEDERGYYDPDYLGSGINDYEELTKAAAKIITTVAEFQERCRKQDYAWRIIREPRKILEKRIQEIFKIMEGK